MENYLDSEYEGIDDVFPHWCIKVNEDEKTLSSQDISIKLYEKGIINHIVDTRKIHNKTYVKIIFESDEDLQIAIEKLPFLKHGTTWREIVKNTIDRRVMLTGIPFKVEESHIHNMLKASFEITDIQISKAKTSRSRKTAKILLKSEAEAEKLLKQRYLFFPNKQNVFFHKPNIEHESVTFSFRTLKKEKLPEVLLWTLVQHKCRN